MRRLDLTLAGTCSAASLKTAEAGQICQCQTLESKNKEIRNIYFLRSAQMIQGCMTLTCTSYSVFMQQFFHQVLNKRSPSLFHVWRILIHFYRLSCINGRCHSPLQMLSHFNSDTLSENILTLLISSLFVVFFSFFLNSGDSVLTPDIRFNETLKGKSSIKDAAADIDVEIVAAVSSSQCYF